MLEIRIFIGGKSGKDSFCNALGIIQSMYGRLINVQMINTDMMKRDHFRFSPKELIDWFLEADIHIIVRHLHQGLDHLFWDMKDLLDEHNRLRSHIGYPGGALDPIFLQDKIKYLQALNEEDCLPTLQIHMPLISEDDKVLISIAECEAIKQ